MTGNDFYRGSISDYSHLASGQTNFFFRFAKGSVCRCFLWLCLSARQTYLTAVDAFIFCSFDEGKNHFISFLPTRYQHGARLSFFFGKTRTGGAGTHFIVCLVPRQGKAQAFLQFFYERVCLHYAIIMINEADSGCKYSFFALVYLLAKGPFLKNIIINKLFLTLLKFEGNVDVGLGSRYLLRTVIGKRKYEIGISDNRRNCINAFGIGHGDRAHSPANPKRINSGKKQLA